MKTQALLVALTMANLALMSYQVLQPHTTIAAVPDEPRVLRGRALEIIDDGSGVGDRRRVQPNLRPGAGGRGGGEHEARQRARCRAADHTIMVTSHGRHRHRGRGVLPNKRLKLAGRVGSREAERLCPYEARTFVHYSCAGGPGPAA